MEPEYANWATNQPNDADDQDCVVKTYFEGNPGWHDTLCLEWLWGSYYEVHAVCQVAK